MLLTKRMEFFFQSDSYCGHMVDSTLTHNSFSSQRGVGTFPTEENIQPNRSHLGKNKLYVPFSQKTVWEFPSRKVGLLHMAK